MTVTDYPPFVTPIEVPGESVPADAFRLSREEQKALDERLEELDRARAVAVAHAHRVWVR